MAFEYINVVTGDILDILERLDNFKIKNHFIANDSLADREHVETTTTGMNTVYVSVIKKLFPECEDYG